MNDYIKIKVKNLSKSFGQYKVFEDLNLDIYGQKSLVIMGGSGTGKSVLIKSIIGLVEPDSGEIIIDNQNISLFANKERFALMKKIGFLFQGGALFDSLNIEDNVTFYAARLFNLNNSDKRDLAVTKLRSVGLSERILDLFPSELSGGMQKRVSLARAICSDPEIIFFDEPTTGLDPIMSNIINDLIIKVKEDLKATTIVITHDMNSAFLVADNIAMIHHGKIIYHGSKIETQNTDNEIVQQFINGRVDGPLTNAALNLL